MGLEGFFSQKGCADNVKDFVKEFVNGDVVAALAANSNFDGKRGIGKEGVFAFPFGFTFLCKAGKITSKTTV